MQRNILAVPAGRAVMVAAKAAGAAAVAGKRSGVRPDAQFNDQSNVQSNDQSGKHRVATHLSILMLMSMLLVPKAHAQAEVKLQCGKIGLVTLSNQFTLITYGDGTSSKRINFAAGKAVSMEGASSLRFIDGTLLLLRTAGGSDYAIQKNGAGKIACTRK